MGKLSMGSLTSELDDLPAKLEDDNSFAHLNSQCCSRVNPVKTWPPSKIEGCTTSEACEGCSGLSSLPELRVQTCCCGKSSVWSRAKFRRWCCNNWLYPRSLTWYDKVCTIRRGKIEVAMARTQ